MLQFTSAQQVSNTYALDVLVTNSELGKKFAGLIAAGTLKARNFDNGEPGGASFHPKSSVWTDGKQAAAPSSSGITRGRAVAPVPT
jgi:hypothetical protein